MKKRILSIIVLVSMFLVNFQLMAQDTIIKKNGDKMEVTIKEVTDTEIKYYEIKDVNKVLFTIDKTLVREVKFNYGKEIIVRNKEEDVDYFLDDKINNFTLNFSALGFDTLGFGYERALKPGQSIMTELKIYGVGIPIEGRDRSGVGLDLAYRLKVKSLFKKNNYRPKHILSGSYFSPLLGFSAGKQTYNDKYIPYKSTHSIFHFGLQIGKQWILQNAISIDGSVGVHYYLGNYENKITVSNDDYSYVRVEPLGLGNMIGGQNKLFSFNLRIGFLSGRR